MKYLTYATVPSLLSIERAWLLEDKRSVLVEKGSTRSLPTVEKKYQPLLDDLNIPYTEIRKSFRWGGYVDLLEIRDPSCLEEEEITLPVYSYQKYKFVCLNPRYRGKTYTSKTIQKAQEIYESLIKKMEEFDFCIRCEDLLKNNAGLVNHWYLFNDVKVNHKYAAISICYKDGKTGYIGRCTMPYLTAVVNLNKVDDSGNIDILVPKEVSIGKLVGQKGWQAKRIADFLGVRHVTFLES